MRPIQHILFDLDGTLTDPAEGIINSIQYSLKKLKLPCPSYEELTSYIGPPLRQSFAKICASSDELLIERAVTNYRERFSRIGLIENKVYEGVPQMLNELQSIPFSLFVATSKPKTYAKRILGHFSLAPYFVAIHGSELNGRLDDKSEIINQILVEHSLSPSETVMVGDRYHDVIAAKANGVSSLGVTYGYGSKEELIQAGAEYVCGDPRDIISRLKALRHEDTF